MSLSTLLSDLISGGDTGTEMPAANAGDSDSDGDDSSSVTVVRECRHCGTNVSAGTAQCPTCDSDDIVTYSIE